MKKIYFYLLLLAFAVLFHVQSGWADKIYLKNGNLINGQITEENDQYILVNAYGGNIKINKVEIQKLTHEAIEPSPVTAAVKATSPAQPESKLSFLEQMKSKINETVGGVKSKSQNSGRKINIGELTNMKMNDWIKMIVKQAFGEESLSKLDKRYLSQMTFMTIIGFILWAFFIKFFVKILGSQCAFSDAFMFQAKTTLMGIVIILFVKGAVPSILFIVFSNLRQYESNIQLAVTILSGVGIVMSFFHFAKRNLDLSPIRSIGLFILSGIALYVIRYAVRTYLNI